MKFIRMKLRWPLNIEFKLGTRVVTSSATKMPSVMRATHARCRITPTNERACQEQIAQELEEKGPQRAIG